MKKVEINLCGNPTIFADGEKVNFPYKKVEGFLYYLCIGLWRSGWWKKAANSIP